MALALAILLGLGILTSSAVLMSLWSCCRLDAFARRVRHDDPFSMVEKALKVLGGYAAMSKLAAMLFMQCAMGGFVGPEEVLLIFRNPETISDSCRNRA